MAYRVVASRRSGQRLGGGRRLGGRRRLVGGGGSATAAPRSRLRLEGRWRGGRRRPAWRATARPAATRRRAAAWQRRRFGAGSAAGGLAAGGSAAAAAWQRRRLGVSSAFAYRSAYRSAYPGTYPCLSQVTDIISMEVPVSQLLAFQMHVTPQLLVLLPLSFSVIKCFCIFCSFYSLEFITKASAYRTAYLSLPGKIHHAPF